MPRIASNAELIARLIDRLGRLLRSEQQAGGLNPAQWEALRYLSQANRFSRSPGALALYLGTTKGTTSQTLLALEKKGLVRSGMDARDRRARAIEITAAGRARLAEDPLAAFIGTAGAMGSSRQATLARDLAAMLERLQVESGRRPFGLCRDCRHFRRNAGKAAGGAPHRCALLEEALSAADSARICVEQESRAA